MTEELVKTFGRNIQSLTLIPSTGGVYEVIADGELIFSKKASGRHAEIAEIITAVRSRMGTE